MTADYKPGTVAMVTYKGQRHKAFRGKHDTWVFWDDRWHHLCADAFSDISPLVVLNLTRGDADLLAEACVLRKCPDRSHNLIDRIAAAIREQVPAPEPPKPPKRWTVGSSPTPGEWPCLMDNGQPVRKFTLTEEVQWVADLLNAAEQTGDET